MEKELAEGCLALQVRLSLQRAASGHSLTGKMIPCSL